MDKIEKVFFANIDKDEGTCIHDPKTINNVLKNFIGLPIEQKFDSLVVTYMDVYERFRDTFEVMVSLHEQLEQYQEATEYLALDHANISLVRNRLEKLLSEYQRQNKILKEVNVVKTKEENELRHIITVEVQRALGSVTAIMAETDDISPRVEAENRRIARRLNIIYDDFKRRQEEADKFSKKVQHAHSVVESKIRRLNTEYMMEKQKLCAERDTLLKGCHYMRVQLQSLLKQALELQKYDGKPPDKPADPDDCLHCQCNKEKINKYIQIQRQDLLKFQNRHFEDMTTIKRLTETNSHRWNMIDSLVSKNFFTTKVCRQVQAERDIFENALTNFGYNSREILIKIYQKPSEFNDQKGEDENELNMGEPDLIDLAAGIQQKPIQISCQCPQKIIDCDEPNQEKDDKKIINIFDQEEELDFTLATPIQPIINHQKPKQSDNEIMKPPENIPDGSKQTKAALNQKPKQSDNEIMKPPENIPDGSKQTKAALNQKPKQSDNEIMKPPENIPDGSKQTKAALNQKPKKSENESNQKPKLSENEIMKPPENIPENQKIKPKHIKKTPKLVDYVAELFQQRNVVQLKEDVKLFQKQKLAELKAQKKEKKKENDKTEELRENLLNFIGEFTKVEKNNELTPKIETLVDLNNEKNLIETKVVLEVMDVPEINVPTLSDLVTDLSQNPDLGKVEPKLVVESEVTKETGAIKKVPVDADKKKDKKKKKNKKNKKESNENGLVGEKGVANNEKHGRPTFYGHHFKDLNQKGIQFPKLRSFDTPAELFIYDDPENQIRGHSGYDQNKPLTARERRALKKFLPLSKSKGDMHF